MKKTLRFGFVITEEEKDALEKLADLMGESQAAFIRKLIRQAAVSKGLWNTKINYFEPNFKETINE